MFNIFRDISLTDYKGNFLVIFFFGSDYENEDELRILNGNFKEFKKISCEIVACSTDSTMLHSKWIQSIKVWFMIATEIPLNRIKM